MSATRHLLLLLSIATACRPAGRSPRQPDGEGGLGAAPSSLACDSSVALLHRLTGGRPALARHDDLGPAGGGGARAGCRVTFDGFSRSGTATFDSLVAGFEAARWRPAKGLQSDAVGTSQSGMYRDGTTCILESLSTISDDEQGAYEANASVQMEISCTATEAGDTL